MNNFINDKLIDLLMISTVFSAVLMSLIQKIKALSYVKSNDHVWLLNLVLSILLGIFFAINFYDKNIFDAIWVGLFSFVGAPTIYELLKKQRVIKYTPKTIDDYRTKKEGGDIGE
jgi:uncharacterized membrane protein